MQGPWQHNRWYNLLRPFVDACTRGSYRHVRVEGLENIPENGAVIIAPNHCNTLMDALVVLRSRKGPTVFGARADIFENPTVAAILRFLRILPMVRRRDGIHKVLRNYETMEQVVDVLANGVPFCMFAEGTHRPKHSLLPVNKGIFRIAKTAHESMNGLRDVYIVPAGLEYGDYFHYRSWSRLRYGKAINVSEYIRNHPGIPEIELYSGLRSLLVGGISSEMVYFPDDENYEPSWNAFCGLFKALTGNTLRDAGLPRGRWRRVLLAAVTAPFFAAAAVLCLPMWAVSELICYRSVRDEAFRNSVRFAVKLLGSVVFGIAWAVFFFCTLPWWGALAGIFCFLCSYSVFYDWLNLVRA